MTTRLVMIRHGITRWNKQKRYCGWTDVGLSPQGRAQAVKLGRKLRGVEFERIYSSDLKRALETAQIIFKGDDLFRVKGLREINFGVLEGLSHNEIMKKYSAVYEQWLKDPFTHRIPKAETMQAFQKRVARSIATIVRRHHGRTVAVVCHGGTIGILIAGILKKKNFWRFVPSSTSMTVVEYNKGRPRIKIFNEASHLG